ncbi:MAG: hypothetical protein AAF489_15015, partial [Bacteroidota bacterium]
MGHNYLKLKYENPGINVRFTTLNGVVLKHHLHLFFYLNICLIFSEGVQAQNLQLKITSEKELSKPFLDSLETTESFSNFN